MLATLQRLSVSRLCHAGATEITQVNPVNTLSTAPGNKTIFAYTNQLSPSTIRQKHKTVAIPESGGPRHLVVESNITIFSIVPNVSFELLAMNNKSCSMIESYWPGKVNEADKAMIHTSEASVNRKVSVGFDDCSNFNTCSYWNKAYIGQQKNEDITSLRIMIKYLYSSVRQFSRLGSFATQQPKKLAVPQTWFSTPTDTTGCILSWVMINLAKMPPHGELFERHYVGLHAVSWMTEPDGVLVQSLLYTCTCGLRTAVRMPVPDQVHLYRFLLYVEEVALTVMSSPP
ncbi:hypothetical protein F2P81_008114 [Scophthalmus maximus]|uniref:Uncharacterized protein n=1 Tax=Scophthalmus maximus TaxID=52904 RepID=A0A6A4T4P0_SCOMX|nr:hypothetical protein F2P81_008114 [Scophthalmus maximus]